MLLNLGPTINIANIAFLKNIMPIKLFLIKKL